MSAVEITLGSGGGGAVLSFTGCQSLEDLRRGREVVLGALAAHPALALELAGVEAADVAFLQLLCATHRTAQAAGVPIALAGPLSPALADLVHRAGIERCPGGPPGCLMRRLRAAAGNTP